MNLYIFIILTMLSGCSMVSYLTEQGIGQAKLQWNGRDNEEILKDPTVPLETKRKIKLVEEYKDFFYKYFDELPTQIYSKTTLLPDKAVSYLVIASQKTKIQAHEFDFPWMGKFPYIGFFKKDSALAFAENLENEQNLVTYVRPVYAYSTLGLLEDRILSSFFEYDDIELAELVFHELFHTVFFIKNEVDLNENLASFYAKYLVNEYFKDKPELERYLSMEAKKNLLSKRVVELIKILQTEFSKFGAFLTDGKANEVTRHFVSEVFLPELEKRCLQLKIQENKCINKTNWNQASFAAYLTYEEEQDFLEMLKKQNSLDLKQYLSWLKAEYLEFNRQNEQQSFTDHLKLKVKVLNAPIAAD